MFIVYQYIIQFKKNNVTREINAWNIGKTIANFQSDTERYIFEKIKEYALATYNYGNLKDIVAENNVEKYIKSLLQSKRETYI